ncbi:galactokinase-like isoform X2 [Convolutriloba macropyga]|uniref:galactokinase-like isoform X2 n=1 Tax=Convolutriloba macropyga TaxID=536237 RepID=UPI003F5269D0
MEELPTLEQLVSTAKAAFNSQFSLGEVDLTVCYAPGRVNIIGEHVDYNGGCVLPMALPMYTVAVGCLTNSTSNITGSDGEGGTEAICRIHTTLESVESNSYQFRIPVGGQSGECVAKIEPTDNPKLKWANYVLGTVNEFLKHQSLTSGFDCSIVSSVPVGGGLSSSASLEAAIFTLLEGLTGKCADKVEKALACQKAEHTFANVPCGIMDQFATVLCQKNKLLMLDCLSQQVTQLDFVYPHCAFLVINSLVKHELGDGAYRKRRAMCEHVATTLGVDTLREISLDQLTANKDKFDQDHFNKALHVVNEISRTDQVMHILSTVEASEENLIAIGQLMNQSHASLRDLYEVSCAEIDLLVETSANQSGVYGARITGGGFGGCCVVLVEKVAIDDLISELQTVYQEKFSMTPLFYLGTPESGASLI